MDEKDFKNIKTLLTNADLKTAISSLLILAKGKSHEKDLLEISAQWNDIERSYNKGHLTNEERLVAINKVTSRLIQCNEDIYIQGKESKNIPFVSKATSVILGLLTAAFFGFYLLNNIWADQQKIKDTRDGQKYDTFITGNKEWVSKNMNYHIKNSKTGKKIDLQNKNKLGLLYDFKEAKTVCQGLGTEWRLPTKTELAGLKIYLEANPDSATIQSFLGGEIDINSNFLYRGENGIVWSETVSDSSHVWILYIHGADGRIELIEHGITEHKFSCRCVREVKNK